MKRTLKTSIKNLDTKAALGLLMPPAARGNTEWFLQRLDEALSKHPQNIVEAALVEVARKYPSIITDSTIATLAEMQTKPKTETEAQAEAEA